eukprot:CAMPEP_0114126000 /NCGR_PEP_ID=MMETSP0043_2-20121206/9597_1 /TAXON_ID=464988 /ORGANISM="Hemiselmis andersenii, Strain CCMP644" /LENGTH=87 /DNA_ID=CAMNT_0001218957 /DNA_START=11 /DNA_END=273 /DNA_ORIENTATION=+
MFAKLFAGVSHLALKGLQDMGEAPGDSAPGSSYQDFSQFGGYTELQALLLNLFADRMDEAGGWEERLGPLEAGRLTQRKGGEDTIKA